MAAKGLLFVRLNRLPVSELVLIEGIIGFLAAIVLVSLQIDKMRA
jgi:hypothetical protein